MSKQSSIGLLFSLPHSANPVNKRRWFNLTEYALLLGSGAGTIASIATQQAMLAVAPLSVLAGLGLISRRQLQTKLTQSQSVMLTVNSSLDDRLKDVQEQLEDLPSHEQLNAVRQSVIAQTQQDILSLSQLFEYTRNMLLEKIEEQDKDIPELQELRQGLAKLQNYYTKLGIDLKDVRSRCQQLSDNSRLETAEATVAKLKSEVMQFRVHMEVFSADTKNNFSGLNDKLQYLKQQVQQLTTDDRQSLLRGEVQELVKTVSEMVSRDEFLELSARLREVQENMTPISQTAPVFSNDQTNLQHRVDTLENQLGTVTESILEAVAETLDPVQNQPDKVFKHLQQRLDATDQQMSTITDNVLAAVAETIEPLQTSPGNQWLFDFDNVNNDKSDSRKALEQLIAQARERIVMVWPWTDNVELDDNLLQQLRQVLNRGCRLDIGWCHQGDSRENILLRTISQRWSEDNTRHRQLKHALNQLLPLKKDYPQLFSFKILGTTENFAVCDSRSAIIGMQGLSTQTSLFPMVKLKLHTTEQAVIQPLIQRFENPVIRADDAVAYFNRGVTRYDMRDFTGAIDDLTQVIDIQPNAAAYNCRGVAWMEMNDYARALQNFTQAIRLNSGLFSARCNRGVLRIDIRDYDGALDDLTAASDLCAQSAIPYFYKGRIFQFLGELRQAVGQFSLAIERQPKLALPYCYRGAAYQKQGKVLQAIADLETAARLLRTTGDVNNLKQVMRKLNKLKQVLQVKAAVVI
ncbi:MAG: tetratricopeptide repeat protein [Leptolyngbyaceae cyanobacterium MAG.088]|nr:tetratricopeptide repeat protein [Leptolyngbyaceae cyanobacterium MAG.088]